jgi:hypothetical protein
MTTLIEDIAEYDRIILAFGKKTPIKSSANLNFAGNYWPPKVEVGTGRRLNYRLYNDVETAFKEVRRVTEAYLVASAAIRGGNDEAVRKMTRWFGDNNGSKTWWEGAIAILSALESIIVKDINVYYRGDRLLIGQPNDYPDAVGNLNGRDIDGYAETMRSVKNSVIGLCEDFFAKTSEGAATVQLRGKDCVAGVLLHELSHNICGTRDHAYSKTAALQLALEADASKAWYNADNIEYFCEDVLYGI